LLNKKFFCFQSSLAPAVYRSSLLRPAVLQLFRSFISGKPTFPRLAIAAVLSDVAIQKALQCRTSWHCLVVISWWLSAISRKSRWQTNPPVYLLYNQVNHILGRELGVSEWTAHKLKMNL